MYSWDFRSTCTNQSRDGDCTDCRPANTCLWAVEPPFFDIVDSDTCSADA
jgi:hypothetical protein